MATDAIPRFAETAMQRYPWKDLVDFGAAFLMSKGVAEPDARYVAEVAAKTEAMGIHTHGLVLLPYLAGKLGNDLDPRAQPVLIRQTPAIALVDGNNGIGQLAMRLAIELARAKARTVGVGMAAVRNSSWIGALGVYLIPLAEEGLMAHLWAQTSTCRDCAPIGGLDARFSTNPIALAFPTGGDPVIADFSTAAVSMGRVGQMIRDGKKAIAPIFMDKEGKVTDDPAVVKEGGTILFTGGEAQGHKGYALSLWCEALTALAGGDCNNPAAPQRQTFCLLVVDPDMFAGRQRYSTEMRRFVAHVKSSRLRPGFDAIRLPGERALACLRRAQREGVSLEEPLAKQLADLAESNRLPNPFRRSA